MFESNAHTFVLEVRVAGLAKRIRQALNEQTGLRLKVRVRGQDSDDVEEDDEAEQSGAESDEATGQTERVADKPPSSEQAHWPVPPGSKPCNPPWSPHCRRAATRLPSCARSWTASAP